MVHPFATFAELAARDAADGRRAVRSIVTRSALMLLVIAAAVSFTTAGRLSLWHLALSPTAWVFVPVFQLVVPAALLRALAPGHSLVPALATYLLGNGPWQVFLCVLAGICLFAPDVYATMMVLLGGGALFGLLLSTMGWSGLLTYAFYRAGVGLARRRAGVATAAHYVLTTLVIASYYLVTNQIQPQL